MRLFELNIDNNTPMYYKPKKIADNFESRYIEHKSEKDKKSSMKEYLEKIRIHLLYIIDGIKKPGEWEKHLKINSKNLSSTDSNENVPCYLVMKVIAA